MNQRGVTLIATYLAKRPLGRVVEVRKVGDDDFIVAVDDVRDGRTQLIHSARDLRKWFESFRGGETLQPPAAICGRCNKLHVDRDVDGELLINCISCAGELVSAAAELYLERETRRDR